MQPAELPQIREKPKDDDMFNASNQEGDDNAEATDYADAILGQNDAEDSEEEEEDESFKGTMAENQSNMKWNRDAALSEGEEQQVPLAAFDVSSCLNLVKYGYTRAHFE